MKGTNPQRTAVRTMHYVSGITLSVFIGFHLLNHLVSLGGPEAHIALMERFRSVYRQPVVESVLLLAVLIQIVTGIRLLFVKRERTSFAKRVQIYSGMYLAFFLIAHVSAVVMGRQLEHLDTNFYFAASGLNIAPATWFFVPYYFLGVCAISLHVAALHYLKTGSKWAASLIAGAGIAASSFIICGHTDFFRWREMPGEYRAFTERYFGKG